MAQKSQLKVFRLFNEKRVRYLLIGVYAIDHYVEDPALGFHTLDCDVLVEPGPKNLLSALKMLEKLGYKFESAGEPIIGISLWFARRLVELRAVITARKPNEMPLDIVLDAGRIPYPEWAKHKKVFVVEGERVPVGGLPMLIRAKENSNREKDRKFLALYKIQLKEMLKEGKRRASG